MAKDSDVSGVWRWMAGILAAALITGAGFWLTFGNAINVASETTTMHEEIKELKTAVELLTTTMNETNLLLRAHGITLENLQPIARGGDGQ